MHISCFPPTLQYWKAKVHIMANVQAVVNRTMVYFQISCRREDVLWLTLKRRGYVGYSPS